MILRRSYTDEFYDGLLNREECEPLTPEEERAVFIKKEAIEKEIAELNERLKNANGRTEEVKREIELKRAELKSLAEGFVQRNHRLVLAMANEAISRKMKIPIGANMDDLVEEGNLTLLDCFNCFKVDKGFKFSTYFSPSLFKRLSKLHQKERRHNVIPRRYAEEDAVYIRLDLEDVISGDFEDKRAISPRDSFLYKVRREASENLIRIALSKLKERERDIIIRRYGLYGNERVTLFEIAERYGLTKERIRQIEREAMDKLKKYLLGDYKKAKA